MGPDACPNLGLGHPDFLGEEPPDVFKPRGKT